MVDYPINAKNIYVLQTRKELGEVAGKDVEAKIIELLNTKDEIRMVFASAPSQEELLTYLASSDKIDWDKIVAFHMDEYLDLDQNAPQLFSTFLKDKLFSNVDFKTVHLINGQADTETEIKRYSELINGAQIDIICLGIGENGHIAFNDPPNADFNDNKIIKEVELDEKCRLQQVNDGCFNSLKEVPLKALTLTIPVLMSAQYLFCVVPGLSKREAVYNTIQKPISTKYPSTILRKHQQCQFYFDNQAYSLL